MTVTSSTTADVATTTGADGIAMAGDHGIATARHEGTATVGRFGVAAAGESGVATAGYGGTATAGDYGIVQIRRWDSFANRYRLITGYVGEGGIESGVPYRLDADARFVRVAGKAEGGQ